MRVGIIIYGSIDTVTGGYIYNHKLLEYLVAQKLEIKIFSQDNTISKRLSNNFSKKLMAEIIAFSPDLILEDELNFLSLFIFNIQLRKKCNAKIISIVHLLQTNDCKHAWMKWLFMKMEYQYLKSVDGFIFTSMHTQQSLVERYSLNKPFLLAHPGKDRLACKDSRQVIKNNKLNIIFIGNLSYNKGLHVLLKALSKIECNLWELSVAGNCSFDSKYTKKILKMLVQYKLENQVKFLGLLGIEDLQKALMLQDILIVPSYYESYGIVYAEAMGAGLPVIACETGGVVEIVMDGINGFLIKPGDSCMLRAYILQLIGNKELLTRLSISALSTYHNLPSWNESMSKIHAFLITLYCTQLRMCMVESS